MLLSLDVNLGGPERPFRITCRDNLFIKSECFFLFTVS